MWRNPLVRGLIAGVVVLVLVVVGGIQGIWNPQNAEIRRLEEERARLEKELRIVARQEREKEALEKEYARLMTQWNLLKTVLPQEEDQPGVLRLIYAAAVKSGVTVRSVRPSAPPAPAATPAAATPPRRGGSQAAQASGQAASQKPALTYRSHAFSLEVRGTFYGVMDFARHLLQAERLGKVDRIQIRYRPEQREREGTEGWETFNVEATFVYTVYSFPEGGAP